MALMSLRELRLSIASASSVIIGTVRTLYGGWFSTKRATNDDVSNRTSLKPSFAGAAPVDTSMPSAAAIGESSYG